jgi:glycosyltransferase involved in cell wall biosynthesis
MQKNNQLNVVQFVRDIGNTGGGNIVVNTAKKMKQRCNTTIVTDMPFATFDPKITVKIIPFGEGLYHWKTNSKFTKTLRHTLQILNFNLMTLFVGLFYKFNGFLVVNNNNEALFGDVISIHNVFTAEMLNHPKGKIQGLSRLLNPVMFMRVSKELLILKLLRNTLIIANSEETKDEFSKYINSKVKIVVIPSGVDIDMFTIDANYSFMKNDKFNLLFVGHEFDRKGLSFLLEALTLLPPNIYLHVVGGRGSNIEYFKSIASNWDISERVTFHGSQTDLIKFYQNADVFVLPSSYEGLPLVCLESMACGLPNLLTCVGGMKNLIKEGTNGYFIKRDANDIAEKVLKISNGKNDILPLKQSARASVVVYSWDNIANDYFNVFFSCSK